MRWFVKIVEIVKNFVKKFVNNLKIDRIVVVNWNKYCYIDEKKTSKIDIIDDRKTVVDQIQNFIIVEINIDYYYFYYQQIIIIDSNFQINFRYWYFFFFIFICINLLIIFEIIEINEKFL